MGTLTCRGEKFVGHISNPLEGEPLSFFFFGNKPTAEELSAGVSTSCTVDISDQTDISKMPVISFALSQENFSGAGTYHAMFENKAALVMFNVSGASSTSGTSIKGMKNQVGVDFATNTFSYSQSGEGEVILPAGNGERWAILLPQDAISTPGADGSVCSVDNLVLGKRPAMPAIIANDYLFEGIDLNLHFTGAISGLFSVGATQQVWFSQGNLQYRASTNTWRFAENQWDYVGTQNPPFGA